MRQNPVTKTIDAVEGTVEGMVKSTDSVVEPYRKSAAKRYPTLFIVAVTFGVAATMSGFERLISEVPWLNNSPLLVLGIGLGVLVATGTLYRKLG